MLVLRFLFWSKNHPDQSTNNGRMSQLASLTQGYRENLNSCLLFPPKSDTLCMATRVGRTVRTSTCMWVRLQGRMPDKVPFPQKPYFSVKWKEQFLSPKGDVTETEGVFEDFFPLFSHFNALNISPTNHIYSSNKIWRQLIEREKTREGVKMRKDRRRTSPGKRLNLSRPSRQQDKGEGSGHEKLIEFKASELGKNTGVRENTKYCIFCTNWLIRWSDKLLPFY